MKKRLSASRNLHRTGNREQQGIALITAVLVAAMVTATAVSMATTQRFSTQRGFNQLNTTLIEHGVRNLESDITRALQKDSQLKAVDSLDEPWATVDWSGEYPNVSTTARVIDLQALFNLQNLTVQFGTGALSSRASTSSAAASSTSPNPEASAENPSTSPLSSAAPELSTATPNTAQPQITNEFDYTEHQEFIDSYVSSCVGENQECAREAIALAWQQARRWGINPSTNANTNNPTQALNDVDNPVNPTTNQLPQTANGPSAGGSGNGVSAARKKNEIDRNEIDSEAQLTALFRALDLDLGPVQAILDWIDADSETRYPNGAEDEYYTDLEVPYRAGNGPFATIRELLLVRGITMEIYEKLSPHLSVLPQSTPININTADVDVLMTIHPMVDRSTAELLINSRNVQPFQTVKAFVEHPALLGLSMPTGHLSTSSEYFLINSTSHALDRQTQHQTVLKRSNTESFVVRRSRGYFK